MLSDKEAGPKGGPPSYVVPCGDFLNICPKGARRGFAPLRFGFAEAKEMPLWPLCYCPFGATTPTLRAPKGPFRQKSVQHLKVQYALCAYWLCQETRHIKCMRCPFGAPSSIYCLPFGLYLALRGPEGRKRWAPSGVTKKGQRAPTKGPKGGASLLICFPKGAPEGPRRGGIYCKAALQC